VLVIIRNLYVVSVGILPNEAQPPLIVYPDTVLASPFSAQRFKVIARRRRKIGQSYCGIQLPELSKCGPFDCPKTSYGAALMKALRIPVHERLDHKAILTRKGYNVKRYMLTSHMGL
jgi:hypothetical protein